MAKICKKVDYKSEIKSALKTKGKKRKYNEMIQVLS